VIRTERAVSSGRRKGPDFPTEWRRRESNSRGFRAADAGFAGVGHQGPESKPKSPEVIMLREAQRTSGDEWSSREFFQTLLKVLKSFSRRGERAVSQ